MSHTNCCHFIRELNKYGGIGDQGSIEGEIDGGSARDRRGGLLATEADVLALPLVGLADGTAESDKGGLALLHVLKRIKLLYSLNFGGQKRAKQDNVSPLKWQPIQPRYGLWGFSVLTRSSLVSSPDGAACCSSNSAALFPNRTKADFLFWTRLVAAPEPGHYIVEETSPYHSFLRYLEEDTVARRGSPGGCHEDGRGGETGTDGRTPH